MDISIPELEGDRTLDKLVLELREAVVEFLPPGADRIRLASTCAALRDAVARVDGKTRRLAPLAPRSRIALDGLGPWLARFGGLRSLSLVGCASDSVLATVAAAAPALPALFDLDVSQSAALTDRGLAALARRRPDALAAELGAAAARPWPRLGVVNAAFCDGTTYGGSLDLRAAFAEPPLVVQRLPPWLQGSFETPWGETHVYFADGSFTFDRSNQAVGYVRWLRQRPPARRRRGGGGGGADADADADADGGGGSLADRFFLADSLQYIDFEPPPGWPPWARFVYRPGVALCPRPPLLPTYTPGRAAGGAGAPPAAPPGPERHVLVAQLLKGLRAPSVLPDVPVDAVPVGGRVFARANGELAPAGLSEDGAAHSFDVMLSCMRVTPLWTLPAGLAHAVGGREGAAEHGWRWLMPPPELVARIVAFERAREALPLDEARLEDVIDAALSGPPELLAEGEADAEPAGPGLAAGAVRAGLIEPELAGEEADRRPHGEPWEVADSGARGGARER